MNIFPLRELPLRIKKKAVQYMYRHAPELYMPGTRLKVVTTMYKFFELRRKAKSSRMIIFMTEGTEFTGLADRFRCIISAYAVARAHGLPFYIYHDKGFELTRYLEPAEVDWRIARSDIRRGLNNVTLLWFIDKWPILKRTRKEYHWYWSMNLFELGVIPEEIRKTCSYSSLFWSLFKMSPHLETILAAAMNQLGMKENEYVAVHIRFLNFFEAVEERCDATDGTASNEEQLRMINRVNSTLHLIHQECRKPIVLFSDSNKFLAAPHPEFVLQLPGHVGHVLCYEHQESVTDKAFVDLMVMSKAACVYSITGQDIYGGGFSLAASFIGNKPFKKVPLAVVQTA